MVGGRERSRWETVGRDTKRSERDRETEKDKV